MPPDPNTCNHEWVEDGTLEVYPPIRTSHCVKCGLRRHIKSSGEVKYYPPLGTGGPHRSVSRPSHDCPCD